MGQGAVGSGRDPIPVLRWGRVFNEAGPPLAPLELVPPLSGVIEESEIWLKRISRRMPPILKARHEPEDIFQSAILAAYHQRGQYFGITKAGANALFWAFIRHEFSNLRRYTLRFRRHGVDVSLATLRWRGERDGRASTCEMEPVTRIPGPLEALEVAELQRQVRLAILDLPAAQRKIVTLVQIEGWSVREASSLMGLTEVAFNSRLARARCALRGSLMRRGLQHD